MFLIINIIMINNFLCTTLCVIEAVKILRGIVLLCLGHGHCHKVTLRLRKGVTLLLESHIYSHSRTSHAHNVLVLETPVYTIKGVSRWLDTPLIV